MQKTGKTLFYSPTDLVRFMESPYSSWMDRLYLEHPDRIKPDEESAEKKLVAQSGNLHELNHLTKIKAAKLDVCEIPKGDVAQSISLTAAAVREGRSVIYQACLQLAPFRGYADFLFKASESGTPVYEVQDTKVARSVKPYHLVQLCCYSEMLASLQGKLPEHVKVILGNDTVEEFRVLDFLNYYRQIKKSFLELMDGFNPEKAPPMPDPRADHGRWQSHADKALAKADHLAQVAGITTGQIKKLSAAGVTTVAALAKVKPGTVPKVPPEILKRLVEQAGLQVQTRDLRSKAGPDKFVPPVFRIIKPAPNSPPRGLEELPPHSPLDVYFDMEGYPLGQEKLEYLFGAVCHDKVEANGLLKFEDWWAHDSAGEKVAFEGFVDWVHARWKKDKGMHVYHYADYERAALRRLSSRHATREDEVDELLRNEVFVDLYQVVRHGLRVGEASYSIKYIELLYRAKRKGDVKTAGDSIVYYANWMESGQPGDWRKAEWLKKIRDYNEDDCQSTHQLAVWLRKLQVKEGITHRPLARVVPEENEARDDALAELQNLRKRLAERLSRCKEGSKEAAITQLFSDLLDFHRREAKPGWWRLFDWLGKAPQERPDDLGTLEGLKLAPNDPERDNRSWIYTYTFSPNSDTKIRDADKVKFDHENLPSATVVEINTTTGIIRLKVSQQELKGRLEGAMPESTAIILHEQISAQGIVAALRQLAGQWADDGQIPKSLERFLKGLAPHLPGKPSGGKLTKRGESAPKAALRLATGMAGSTLCIQGPPGTGKTTTAAAIIAQLLNAGKRVGMMSNSHKAIQNLLRATNKAMGGKMPGVYAGKSDDGKETGNKALQAECPALKVVQGGTKAVEAYSEGVLGGTAWLFSRDELVGELDHLFIDEAGQVSLANLVAVSRCTANLVLMGDQMQLEQPIQGTHPGESGQSALNYYLQEHATIPDDLGIFLGLSYRMHPDICQFVSEMAYEGRLQAAPETSKQSISLSARGGKFLKRSVGILFSPVEHDGNTQGSDEEVQRIHQIVGELLGAKLTDRQGKTRNLALDDILFVAPYNMQVRKLQECFPKGRVGSVDKFQGQEAPVVILSMCSSPDDFGSRGLEFLLDKNRMNVAISRAQTLTIIVGDPRIATTQASTVEQMEKLNLFCRLVQENS